MIPQERSISTKQFVLLTFILTTAGKCFALPLAMLKIGGRSAWIPFVVFLLADLCAFGMLLAVSALHPNKTAFELMEDRLGKIPAKIILFFVVLYLTAKVLLLVFNLGSFICADLFEELSLSVVLIPLVCLLVAFGVQSLRAIGRTAEILIYIFLAALALILFLLYGSANFMRMLPLFSDSEGNIVHSFMHFSLDFGDFAVFFIVLGQIKRNKHTALTVGITAVIAALIVLFYAVLVFSAYADVRHIIDIQKAGILTQTSIARFSAGRFDKIAYTVLAAGIILSLAMMFHAAVHSTQYVFGTKRLVVPSVILAVFVYILAVFLDQNIVYDFRVRVEIYFAPLFSIGFPLLLLILAIHKKRTEKTKRRISGTKQKAEAQP